VLTVRLPAMTIGTAANVRPVARGKEIAKCGDAKSLDTVADEPLRAYALRLLGLEERHPLARLGHRL
jgi:hypothetical protein